MVIFNLTHVVFKKNEEKFLGSKEGDLDHTLLKHPYENIICINFTL